MKKILLYSLFTFLSISILTTEAVGQKDFRKNPPAPGPAPKIEIGSYEQFTLDNGLKVIVVENDKLPRVSFQVFVDAPEVHEGESAGYIDMAGGMLTRGTETRSKAEIDQAVDFMGASLNSSASGIFASCLTKHTEGLLDIMSDVLLNPTFPEEEFEKVKKQTISGLNFQKDDPNTIAANVGAVLRYGKDHPYGNIQSETTTEKITVDMCKEYYGTYFKPNISYLIIVGDITAKKAKPLAEKYFGSWEKGMVAKTKVTQPQRPEEPRVVFVDKSGAVQSVINITYPIDLRPGSGDAAKIRVLNTLLGGYFRSRLNNNLREDKGYTYGARSSISSDPLVGSFRAYASVRNEVTDSSMTEFLHELDRIRTEKVEGEELDLVKNYVTGNFALSLENPQTIARFALNTVRYDLSSDYYSEYLKKVSKVTPDDVMTLAQKFVTPSNAYLLVVGNKGEVAEKLAGFDKDGEIEFLDINGNPIDELALPEGVTAETVIGDYLEAIGGKDKLAKVNGVKTKMSTDSPMGKLEMTTVVKKPNMFFTAMSAGGNEMQKQVFDGETGKVVAMGQNIPLEEDQIADLKVEAVPFKELNYFTDDFDVSLAGLENVDGTKAYKVIVKTPSGSEKTEYYAMETSLKIREVTVTDNNGQAMTITQDFTDYKEVEGIRYPHTINLSGMAPIPLKMTVEEVKWNPEVDNAMFK
jgi:zinc protease